MYKDPHITYKPKHPFYNFKPAAACGMKPSFDNVDGWNNLDVAKPCLPEYNLVRDIYIYYYLDTRWPYKAKQDVVKRQLVEREKRKQEKLNTWIEKKKMSDEKEENRRKVEEKKEKLLTDEQAKEQRKKRDTERFRFRLSQHWQNDKEFLDRLNKEFLYGLNQEDILTIYDYILIVKKRWIDTYYAPIHADTFHFKPHINTYKIPKDYYLTNPIGKRRPRRRKEVGGKPVIEGPDILLPGAYGKTIQDIMLNYEDTYKEARAAERDYERAKKLYKRAKRDYDITNEPRMWGDYYTERQDLEYNGTMDQWGEVEIPVGREKNYTDDERDKLKKQMKEAENKMKETKDDFDKLDKLANFKHIYVVMNDCLDGWMRKWHLPPHLQSRLKTELLGPPPRTTEGRTIQSYYEWNGKNWTHIQESPTYIPLVGKFYSNLGCPYKEGCTKAQMWGLNGKGYEYNNNH